MSLHLLCFAEAIKISGMIPVCEIQDNHQIYQSQPAPNKVWKFHISSFMLNPSAVARSAVTGQSSFQLLCSILELIN